MALNAPASATDFLQTLKGVLVAPDVALENVSRFRDWLYSLGADTAAVKAALTALYPTITPTEAGLIVDAINALHQLRLVATAQATQGAVDDFFFNAKKVWGFNPSRR